MPDARFELPPIPERIRMFAEGADLEAIQAWGEQCILMERERCAKVCESQKFWVVVPELAELAAQGDVMTDVLNYSIYGPVAAAIRKG